MLTPFDRNTDPATSRGTRAPGAGVPCPWPDTDISSHEAATCGYPFRPGEGEEEGEE